MSPLPSAPPAGQGAPEAVTFVVTPPIKPEFEADYLELPRAFAGQVCANEQAALLYVLTKQPPLEHTYVWVERYRDEAAPDHRRATAYMAEVLPRLRKCVDGPPELLHLEQVVPA